jgi:hypothetical protein
MYIVFVQFNAPVALFHAKKKTFVPYGEEVESGIKFRSSAL